MQFAKKRAQGLGPVVASNYRKFGVTCVGVFVLVTAGLHLHKRSQHGHAIAGGDGCGWFSQAVMHGPVLVSYSYFEKDDIQRKDFEFFISVGMGIQSTFRPPPMTDFSIVVNGDVCDPCETLYPLLHHVEVPEEQDWLKLAKEGSGITMLWRNENEGMDFAAHNATLEWHLRRKALRQYKYFIFLNSSVRGPFYPSYMPEEWSWTRAYTDYLREDVKAVSSSLVCLPAVDAGGYGAKLESWAFALDMTGLRLLMAAGTFHVRTCKLCDDGVVVQGEYGITNVLFSKGYNIATLMYKYDKKTDWRESKNWRCNNNAHPSRHGTYDGISMNPFEVVFLKAGWHVGEPFVQHYTDWVMDQAEGKLTTRGSFDDAMYRWGVSLEAQEPPKMDVCFDVMSYDVRNNTPLNRREGFEHPN